MSRRGWVMSPEAAVAATVAEAAAGFDPRDFRRSLGLYATGVAVVTAVAPDGERVGLTINSFASVSLDPPLVLWSLAKTSPRLGLFSRTGHFAVNILAKSQEDMGRRFARPGEDRFAGLDTLAGAGGAPLLPGCLAQLECRLEQAVEGGDHLILIGRVLQHRRCAGLDALVFCNGAFTGLPTEAM